MMEVNDLEEMAVSIADATMVQATTIGLGYLQNASRKLHREQKKKGTVVPSLALLETPIGCISRKTGLSIEDIQGGNSSTHADRKGKGKAKAKVALIQSPTAISCPAKSSPR